MKTRRGKTRTVNGNYSMRPVDMLNSPAMRVLSVSGHRVLMRIEIELVRHGGKDNGALPVTHKNFQEFGIHHHAVGPAVREVCVLGLVEQTQRGSAGVAEHRRPSTFRLTYRNTGRAAPTDEWKAIRTIAEAEVIAAGARAEKAKRQGTFHQKSKPSSMPENAEPNAGFRHRGSMPVSGISTQNPRCRKPAVLSRSSPYSPTQKRSPMRGG